MNKKIEMFVEHNKTSKITRGWWDDSRTKLSYRTDDGCVFVFTADEVKYMNDNKIKPDWGFKPE